MFSRETNIPIIMELLGVSFSLKLKSASKAIPNFLFFF